MKKIAVVILNYKSKDQVLMCLESVKKSSYENVEIIIMDNNSGDGIESEVKKYGVYFIQNGENLGFTGGNNGGIKRALEIDCDYIFILNPDTTIDKDCIKYLAEGLEKDSVGIVCPKIYFANSKKIWFAGKVLDFNNVLGNHIGVNEQDYGQYDKDQETDDITGAAMMVRKEVFESVGLFDEKYFLYYEESDFSYRAKKKGFKLMYIPKAIVFHKNAQTTGVGSSLQDYFITRNRMLFASKFLSLRTQFALIREALRSFANPSRRLALFDFLLGKFGKGSFKI